MAPRRRIQDGDPPQGAVEEGQLVNVEVDQAGGNNDGAEVPNMAPNSDLGDAVVSLHKMMEENRKATEENRKATEETRQIMAESRRLIEEARAMARQVKSQVDCLNSRVDRRLAQLFELVNKNTNDLGEFRQLLNRPVLQTRALSSDGRDFPNLESENVNLPSNGGGRGEQPRPVNPTPPVTTTVPTPQRVNVGESHATSSKIHVEQPPPRQGVARQNISEARPYIAPVNVGMGLGPNNVDPILPREYSQQIPPPMNMQGVDPGGFIPLGRKEGGMRSHHMED
ncbi:unnamed protein product [Linum trigynum]|uniref:Uncharacterized protein n=1 Tax=Linum trigynum TaxID=586398 RepID=A0AAV2FH12_9ROSI